MHELTCSTLLHFPCGRTQDIKNLNNHLHHHVRHFRSWWDCDINYKSSEGIADPLKHINKEILACFDILGCLKTSDVTRARTSQKGKANTWRRTPTPTNIALAGEKTCWVDSIRKSSPCRSNGVHQTDPFAECLRKRVQNVDCWTKPALQSLVSAPGLGELVDLVLKYDQNGFGRVAFLKLDGERMRDERLASLHLIFLKRFLEDDVEIGRRRFRHERFRGRARSGRFIHDEEMATPWYLGGYLGRYSGDITG